MGGLGAGWTGWGATEGWWWRPTGEHPCGVGCPNVLRDPDTLCPSTHPQCTVCSPGAPRTHKWSYRGSCPKSLEDSSWIPFRDHCYTFHMEITLGQKDAMRRCQKGMGGRGAVGAKGGDAPLEM